MIQLKNLIKADLLEVGINVQHIESLLNEIDDLLYQISTDCDCVHYSDIKKMQKKISKILR